MHFKTMREDYTASGRSVTQCFGAACLKEYNIRFIIHVLLT